MSVPRQSTSATIHLLACMRAFEGASHHIAQTTEIRDQYFSDYQMATSEALSVSIDSANKILSFRLTNLLLMI